MTRLTVLTDGFYQQCEACIGKVVEGTPFENAQGNIVGYDLPVTELIRVGATFNAAEWEADATIFFSTEYDIPEIEVMQDEYR